MTALASPLLLEHYNPVFNLLLLIIATYQKIPYRIFYVFLHKF
nr:MAG TPA: hypothetical protein [Caudoviricetes sp.]